MLASFAAVPQTIKATAAVCATSLVKMEKLLNCRVWDSTISGLPIGETTLLPTSYSLFSSFPHTKHAYCFFSFLSFLCNVFI